MKSKAILKTIVFAVGILLLLFLVLAAIYHKAAYAVFRNLTVPVLPLDESSEWTGGTTYEEIPYASDSESQYLDLYVPEMSDSTKPQLFVLIHGGGFVAGDSQTRQVQWMYRYFRDRGYACATVNYRLAQEAAFPAGLSDCKAAIRFLRAHADEYGYDAEKIPVFGESAGGYLAVMCAVTDDTEFHDVTFLGQEELGDVSAKVDVLVDYYGHIDNRGTEKDWKALGIPQIIFKIANSWMTEELLQGFDDFQSVWFRKNTSEMSEEEYAAGDPYTYIRKNDLDGLSVWIIHGNCDITVPYLESERLYQALSEKLGADAVSFRLESDMGHASDPLYADEILAEIDQFIKSKFSIF